MKILKFKIHNFKPMMHHDKTKIEVEIRSDVLVIIGCNGSGKSMLAYELNPYAAIKPMYCINGFKQLHIEHEGDFYILTSDFTKTNHTHSFIKNHEELNLSGNSQVQNELVDNEFKLTPICNDIINFRIHLTSMTRTKRKELLFKAYPNDLNFVLQKHKTILSLVRDCKANLKLLEKRKALVTDKLLTENNLTHLTKLKNTILSGNNLFDQIIFICNNEIEECKLKQVEYEEDYNIKAICNHQLEINRTLDTLSIRGEKAELTKIKERYSNDITHTVTKQKQLLLDGIKLKEEIEKYEEYLDSNVSEETIEAQQQITRLNQLINKTRINHNIPVISKDELNILETSLYNEIDNILTVLYTENRILTISSINKCNSKIREYQWSLDGYSKTIEDNSNKLHQLNKQLHNELNSTYNNKCNLTCKLKTNKEESIKTIESFITGINKENIVVHEKITKLKHQLKLLNTLSEYSTINRGYIERIHTIFSRVTWGNFVLNNQSLNYTMNNNISIIDNNLKFLIVNNKTYYDVERYKKDLEIFNIKLSTLKAMQLPAKELISKTLLDKQSQITILQQNYKSTVHKEKEYHTRINEYNQILDIINICESDNQRLTKAYKYLELQGIRETHTIIRDNCIQQKSMLTNKLVDIENTLREQLQYATVLNTEIIPTLKDITKRFRLYKLIEQGLSPNAGLPKHYMIRFINSILEQVNKYISLVWSYSMQLELLNTEVELNFEFKVKINNNTYVKDISMLSTAQKEIVDFAFILTMYNLFKLNSYPLKLDEIEAGFSEQHRISLLEFLGNIMRDKQIGMIVFINHHAQLYSCFNQSQTIALSENGITLPNNYNEDIILE